MTCTKSPIECAWERGFYAYLLGGFYTRECVTEYEKGYYCRKEFFHKEPPDVCPSCWKNVVVNIKTEWK